MAGPRPLFYPQSCLPPPGALQHSCSMSMLVPRSPPSAASPISLCSSSSGHGSESSAAPRPSSCGASTSCSPSDAGFMSLDEYSSSPVDAGRPCLRAGVLHHHHRSSTQESVAETPPTPGREMNGYMCMERPPSGASLGPLHHCRLSREELHDPAHRKREYLLTTPARQRSTPLVSSASLDEATLLRVARLQKMCAYEHKPKTSSHVENGWRRLHLSQNHFVRQYTELNVNKAASAPSYSQPAL